MAKKSIGLPNINIDKIKPKIKPNKITHDTSDFLEKSENKSLTYLQQQVQKEMKRIKNYIARKEKEGYQFIHLPNLDFDPQKARTKQLNMLRELTSKKLMQEKSEWVDPETGEIYRGKQGVSAQKLFSSSHEESYNEAVQQFQYENSEQDSGAMDVDIYQQVRDIIEDLPNSGYSRQSKTYIYFEDRKAELLSMLDDLIGQANDPNTVYNYLRQHEAEISKAGKEIVGDSDGDVIKESYIHIAIILNNGMALTHEQGERLEEQYADLTDGGEW